MEPNSSMSQSERKRKFNDEEVEEKKKQVCNYGTKCYRKNPDHIKEYSHVSEPAKKRRTIEDIQTTIHKSDVPFFLTTVEEGIDRNYNHQNISRSLSDILALDCQKLIETCQFNYMFDIPWLISKYPHSVRDKPLLLVHGFEGREKLNLQSDALKFKNIDLVQAKLPIPYGTHHTKMMILLYEDGCRVVIHTANLIQQDWYQKTQGLWMSPFFQKKSTTKSTDHFKTELFEYIWAYKNTKLTKWIEKLKDFDMTNAGVHILGSIPGRHFGASINRWGHLRLKKLLSQYGPTSEKMTSEWPVVGQFSSIGSLGKECNQWLTSEWLTSLSQCSKDINKPHKAELKLIFPTMENVRNSLEGYSAGGSLPFSVENATKQRYMRQFLCEWKSDELGRSKACPHIKTYTRLSPQQNQAAWFLLTSANLSKAAWGALEKNATQLMIRSYEIGVLFLPNDNELPFNLLEKKSDNEYLRLPFDVPLSPYKDTDKPWVWNIRYTKEDSHGKLWIP